MAVYKLKVHYIDFTERPVCGSDINRRVGSLTLTSDHKKVTCKRCRSVLEGAKSHLSLPP